ncbi:MAG: histidinol-phosphate transaminase [Kiritimatiellae bacterium]|nr:histidinol-phosphate transaminase [Kiritimatiellia bacterium]
MRIAASVRALEGYVPGEQPKSSNVIKLNTNENPYPPSPAVAEVLRTFDVDRLRKYPDPIFTALRERLAEIHNTVPERIFVGNGSDEILTLAARAFVEDGEAIGSFNPSYSLYKTLAEIRNVPFRPTELAEGFAWAEPDVAGNVALFILTNPNAPTSIRYEDEKIAAFAKDFPGVVLIDEAYADFALKSLDSLAAAPGNENTIVMRTLSKSYSLAGLRLGYAIGPVDLIDALYKVKDSYNIDAIAQAVALAALQDIEWMRANTAKVIAERNRLAGELLHRGWDVPESATNFLFARPPAPHKAADVFKYLRGRNIFVRYFTYPRTDDRIRITIGTPDEMDALVAALDAMA